MSGQQIDLPETITMTQLRAAFEALGLPRPELCAQLTVTPAEVQLITVDIAVSATGAMTCRSGQLIELVIPLDPR